MTMTNPEIVLFGKNGRLGKALMKALGTRVMGIERRECDFRFPEMAQLAVAHLRPALVINCVAMNGMEQCQAEPARAYAINALTPAALAETCTKIGARFIHFSSDYAALPELARGTYGASKRFAEDMITQGVCRQFPGPNVLVARLSSIYTSDDMAGSLDALKQWQAGKGQSAQNPIKVLDQITTPTSVRAIVAATLHEITNPRDGTFVLNMVDHDDMSKHAFAVQALELFFGVTGAKVVCGELPIRRPARSVLISHYPNMPTVMDDLRQEAELWKSAHAKP